MGARCRRPATQATARECAHARTPDEDEAVQAQRVDGRQRGRLLLLRSDLVHGPPKQVVAALLPEQAQQLVSDDQGAPSEEAARAAHEPQQLAVGVERLQLVVQARDDVVAAGRLAAVEADACSSATGGQ